MLILISLLLVSTLSTFCLSDDVSLAFCVSASISVCTPCIGTMTCLVCIRPTSVARQGSSRPFVGTTSNRDLESGDHMSALKRYTYPTNVCNTSCFKSSHQAYNSLHGPLGCQDSCDVLCFSFLAAADRESWLRVDTDLLRSQVTVTIAHYRDDDAIRD